ncbi:carbon starvation protein A [Bacillus mangrovi]|uniref:Carbon starvation protein A n=1 Tax=Metabacillus mangrovi TaxID=1491830 RepID=A0A7X2V506_9BACI|nr:carbon starvation CstA family protein [Metabacillus mangrovi]MTH53686.1 carbon starvation protein A [Metabacillus mangrovi]
MLTFLASIALLVLGYLVYAKVVERIFGIQPERKTPAYTKEDGLDYAPMPWWKGWLIQLLNIAGLGPIFGALMGALYGPVAFIWIVFGCIFAGAVHDYFSGMMSLRHNGEQYPAMIGRYLGKNMKHIINVFSLILMILVAAAFTAGPAQLIAQVTPLSFGAALAIIFVYFLIATILPVNKVIGRIYPLFGAILIFMAVAIALALLFAGKQIPNLTFENLHPKELPIWPLLMVTVSCGAISGFHCTQSPIVARTLKNEKDGRKVFYGAMVGEGIIALIWAAAGMTLFNGTDGLQAAINAGGPAGAVNEISTSLLGTFGGILAILGVIILPITTGDTALRSSRMILSEMAGAKKKADWKQALLYSIPVSIPALYLSTIDYSFLWRYVGWSNQVVAAVTLWAATVYCLQKGKFHWICGIPAMFMTAVVTAYIFYAPEGFGLDYTLSMTLGSILTVAVGIWYVYQIRRYKQPLETEAAA